MFISRHALLNLSVSLSSSMLGIVCPEGWLWQKAIIVARLMSASRSMMRISTVVWVIPPLLTVMSESMWQAWFMSSAWNSSCGSSPRCL